ncbi:MAG: substrate-binding region of ABC-type glycine betaine transport system [Osedax symbiont Rs1]|nr:MAG: substrate-binding region of ABC-type glycine betaine transport system [Osedax symbiont Rs1]
MSLLKSTSVKTFIGACCLSLAVISASVAAKDSTKPIVIPIHNWSSQIVMAHVIGGIFESMGNNVEFVPADTQAVYESIRIGDVTISHEVWQSTFGKSFYNAMAKGGVIDAGTHAATTLEEMGVPNWVIEQNLCPGLPNWEALKEEACYKNFTTADSEGKGRWLEGPQSWHGDMMPIRLKALGLDEHWTVKFAGGADALWTELVSAKKEGRGTMVFNWTPNFTDAEGYTFIKFPEYTEGCRKEDGGDGKCGSPNGWLKKAANYKFPKTHPAAYTAFSKISFTTKQVGEMAALVDIEKMDHQDAAKKWLADNEKTWKAWTK